MVHKIRSKTLRENLLALTSGTIVAQIIVVASSMVIARLYSPEIFGIQGGFLALVSILSHFVAMRYPMAIVIAKTDHESLQIIRLSLITASCFSLLVLLVLLVAWERIITISGADGIGGLIFFLPLALFFVGLKDIMIFWTARLKAFVLNGKVSVLEAFLTNMLRIVGGIIHASATTLVLVTSISSFISASSLWLGVKSKLPARQQGIRGLAATAKQHVEFPLMRVPADCVNALSQSLPVLLLLTIFNPASAGFYALARSVVNLPLNVVGMSVGTMLYDHMAEIEKRNEPLFPFVLKATFIHFIAIGLPLFICSLSFPLLFTWVFGENWRTAGEYAQWMSLWIVLMLCSIPTVRILPIIKKQGLHLVFNVIILSGGMIGFVIGTEISDDPLLSIIGYSLASCFCYILQIMAYLNSTRKFDRKEL